MKTLVLFDFDGTITDKDSLVEFIKFSIGTPQYYLGMIRLLPMLMMYKLGFLHNQRAKEKMLLYFFRDIEKDKFTERAREYSLTQIDKIVRAGAMAKLQWHHAQGHKVVIVSASIECWLHPWCQQHDIELLSTRLSFSDGRFDGRFETPNCYGKEKEHRVRIQYNLNDYTCIYTYGDSAGDKELLALGDKRFYKPFRD